MRTPSPLCSPITTCTTYLYRASFISARRAVERNKGGAEQNAIVVVSLSSTSVSFQLRFILYDIIGDFEGKKIRQGSAQRSSRSAMHRSQRVYPAMDIRIAYTDEDAAAERGIVRTTTTLLHTKHLCSCHCDKGQGSMIRRCLSSSTQHIRFCSGMVSGSLKSQCRTT